MATPKKQSSSSLSSSFFETIKKLLISLSIILFVYELSSPKQYQEESSSSSSSSLRSSTSSFDYMTVNETAKTTTTNDEQIDVVATFAPTEWTTTTTTTTTSISNDEASTSMMIQAAIAKQNVMDQIGESGSTYFPHNNYNLGTRTEPAAAFIAKQELPKIAWLMSFPNSGTSYTMTTVEMMSNLSTATNYADEVTKKPDFSIPIHPLSPEGPYWEGLSGKMGKIRQLPSEYVLVKTHCGSRCIHCSPDQYMENITTFGDACRNTTGRVPPDAKRQISFYPLERVHKVVHVIRNPYHNFIARFHLDIRNMAASNEKKKKKKNKTKDHDDEDVVVFPNNAEGFKQWCAHLDTTYQKEEQEVFEYELAKQVQLSPCHGEVFKYIQWHNLAFQLTESMGVESHVVYYENYTHSSKATMKEILDFLHLPTVISEPREFKAKDYDQEEYYSHLERRRMRLLAERIASPKTWEAVKHYFPLFKRENDELKKKKKKKTKRATTEEEEKDEEAASRTTTKVKGDDNSEN